MKGVECEMKKTARKWIARVLVFIMIATCVPMYQKQEVKAADFSNGGCVKWVKARAAQIGITLPPTGYNSYGLAGASAFWTNLPAKFKRGNEPAANALAIWKYAYGQKYKYYGHVAYVEKVDGNIITLTEGGAPGYTYAGNTGVRSIRMKKDNMNSAGASGFLGYVYLKGTASAPGGGQSSSVNASVLATCDEYNTNLIPRAMIYNPGRKLITTVGFKLRDGNNVLIKKEETMTATAQRSTSAPAWYDCNKEFKVWLKPGHVYNWQIYAVVGGKKFWADAGGKTVTTENWIYTKTTGTAKPNSPSFNTSKTDYAVGDAVTVSWGADNSATAGYSLTLTQTKGGSYSKTLSTSTAKATSLAFTLPSEGEYKITGFARGSSNSGVSTLNKTIVAHSPSQVRFVEYDKEGNENLLCEQSVRYGYSATAPIGISRKGHTFTGWKGDYSNVTSDRTIEAQFKRNSYKIVFCDKDGNTIKTQSVLFGDDAEAPVPPEAESGYVFAGWDSEDYKNVQGNATVRASYVWGNSNLPVVITLNKCEFKEDGYIVNYDIKNNPDKRTKGRALVSLKTSKGKLLDSTESKAFSLDKAEEKKGIEIYVPYEGAATKAELYIIDGFTKGIPISEVATVEVSRNWSEWSTDEPDQTNEVESRTEYRYQEQEKTTTRTNSNPGWTLENSVLDSNWSYGGWSGWSRNSYGAYTNQTSKRDVETRNVQDSPARTLYNWYYYRYYNSSARTYYYTYSSSMGGTRYNWQTDYCLPQFGTYSGHVGYRKTPVKNFANEIWFLASKQNVAATSHKEWRYRDATKGYTYFWKRWKDWSDWSPTEVRESDNNKVETRTTYRYRARMEEVEDNSGKSYTVSGKLDVDLAGKQATLLVHKNDEPSDSNNEYVGQVTIGVDGSYSYEFIPRQPVSAKTGDFTVVLAVEGAENPVFLETITAPKPTYTVTFKDEDGSIIDTQQVMEGKSAVSPKVPDKEHYSFVGWDYGFTNIRDDMDITAQYAKNKYSVAYVNWETKEAETRVFSYGDALEYPDEGEMEGYDFTGWTTLDGEQVTEVTENFVLQANYKVQSYTVNFYNKEEELIDTQIVDYGQDAIEPDHEEIKNMDFKGWNTYGFIQAKSDLDVYPVYEWKETTANPTCDTKSGVFTNEVKVHLEAEQGAVIYYTTDGSMPNEFSNKYTGEITVSTNTYLQFVALSPQKNISETQSVSLLIANSKGDSLSLGKNKYQINRGEDEKIDYSLKSRTVGADINFYSLDEDVATVGEDGTIFANNVGNTKIFVITGDNECAEYCDVEVTTTDVDVESIVLNKTSVVGAENEVIQMQATVYPENATEKEVDWYTDDSSIATVSKTGELKILKKGSTMLHAVAKSGTCIAECEVQGVSEFDKDELKISIPYLLLYEKEMVGLYAYRSNADVLCKWESDNEDIVSVDNEGFITAKKLGQAIITATAEDGTQVTSLVVVTNDAGEVDSGTSQVPGDSQVIVIPQITEKPEPTVSPQSTGNPQTTSVPQTTDKAQPTAFPQATENPQPTESPQITAQPTATNSPSGEKETVIIKSKKKPTKVTNLTVKKCGKKKLRVSWKKQMVSGFQVQYALNKKFRKNKKKKVTSFTSIVLRKLKRNKIYYVRVRAYKKINGKKIYGVWSKVRKCRVK